MEGNRDLPGDWVKLNVGGEKFYTTLKTLCKGDTMLSTMFSSQIPKAKDDNGFILIDRDGTHFNKILNYLRNSILPELKNANEAKEIQCEAEFYCIEELKNYCIEESKILRKTN